MALDIKAWIRKTPQPAALLCDEKRIEIPRNARSWKDLAATVVSLEPSKLTALAADGSVIRAVVLEADDDKAPPPSAEMSDVQLFARLLAEAYEKGSHSTKPVIEAAMQFVEAGTQRALAADREIERLRTIIHKQHMQIADLSGAAAPAGGDEGVLGALVAGAMQAAGGGAIPLGVVGNGKAAVKK